MSNLLNIQPRESLQMGRMLVSNPAKGKAPVSCHRLVHAPGGGRGPIPATSFLRLFPSVGTVSGTLLEYVGVRGC